MFKSTVKAKRQLVESSLIATNTNCILKPGDFPVCRLTASVVTKCLKLDYNKTPPSTTNASPSTPVTTNSNVSVIPTSVPTIPANVVSTIQCPSPTIAPTEHRNSIQAPSAPCSTSSPKSPLILQSQARALSQSQAFASIVLAASNCPSPTPVAHKTRKRRILSPPPRPPRPPPPPSLMSPYTSPTTPTGAISKRSKRRTTPYTLPVRSLPTAIQPQAVSPTTQYSSSDVTKP